MAAPTEPLPSSGPTAVRLPRLPPLKVLAEQLRRDAEGGPGSWRLSRAAAGREPLELTAVWMQGTVVEVGGGEARLRDPSGFFSVRGLERVPRGRPCLVPGNSRARTLAGPRFVPPEGGAVPSHPQVFSRCCHVVHQLPYPSFLPLPSQAPAKTF